MSEPPPPGSESVPAHPGLGLTGLPPTSLFPFMSQIETWPVRIRDKTQVDAPAKLRAHDRANRQGGRGRASAHRSSARSAEALAQLPVELDRCVETKIAKGDLPPFFSRSALDGCCRQPL